MQINTIKVFKSLSEPLRIRILNLLVNAPLSVSEMVLILDQSQSNISHHIKHLHELRLLSIEKHGNQNLYTIVKNPNLSQASKIVWKNLELFIKELPEAKEDHIKLLSVLRKRSESKGAWQKWRNLQPDLPFTYELAFRGMPLATNVLDIGCGDGSFLHTLAPAFASLYGIDITDERIKSNLQNLSKKANFLIANAEKLPFEKLSFNSIFFRMTLRFISNTHQAIQEAHRVLAPSGRIAIIDLVENKSNNQQERFDLPYFQKLCMSFNNLRVIHFVNENEIIIAVLEKTN